MRIQSVTLTAFGPFTEETTVNFPDEGLNLVLGPNESGKSLLMKAISAVLFGLPAAEVDLYRSGASPEGRVRLELDDHDIEIIRYFDTRTAIIWELTENDRRCIFSGDDSQAYGRELERLVGFQDEDIATGTTFVSHGEMRTQVSEKLRDVLCRSKRTDYERILHDLQGRHVALTRVDPWTSTSRPADGQVERVEQELTRAIDSRGRADKALGVCMRLEEEAHRLEQQLSELQAEDAAEARTLEALGTLEGLQGEERGLEAQVREVEINEGTVRKLQEDLGATIDRVNSEHAPLLPMQTTFLDDVQSLQDNRAELARVQKEADEVNAHRAELQGHVRRLSQDYASLYGAYEDLPLDFPRRLALYPVRDRELATITSDLGHVDHKIAELHGAIDQHYARFKRFDETYGDQLRDLGVQETFWRQQLLDLEGDQLRCQETANEIKLVEHSLQYEFAPFSSVAKDFRSRLRNWHRLWQELQARKGPVMKAQEEIADIQAALDRYQGGAAEGGAAYTQAFADRERIEVEVARLETERDNLVRLNRERQGILQRFDTDLAHVKDKVKPDFPDKLREHLQLREEYLRKNGLLQAARDRLKQSADILAERFSRFDGKDSAWGARLEEHRQTVEKAQSTLDRLKREESQVGEVAREFEILNSLSADDGDLYDGLADNFPETLREYSRVKARLKINEQENTEHASLFAEFSDVGNDFVDKITRYRTDQATLHGLGQQINEGRDTLSRHERRLAAMDIVLREDYPHFKADHDLVLGALMRVGPRRRELQTEMAAAVAKRDELLDERSKDKGFGALLGWNTQQKKDISTQDSRISSLETQLAGLDKEAQALRKQLGPLGDREDLEVLETEYATYRKLLKERTALAGQIETIGATLKTMARQSADLESGIQALVAGLGVASEVEATAALGRYQEYLHLSASKQEDLNRLAELASALGSLTGRFTGDPKGYSDLVHTLIEGFRTHKKRQIEIEALKARLATMPDQAEIAILRNQTLAAVAEGEKLGIQPGESVDRVVDEWREFQTLQRRMEADEAVVKELEQDADGQNRLQQVTTRLEQLAVELGMLVAHPDIEALIDEINVYFTLHQRLQQLDAERAGFQPLQDVEKALAAIKQERRTLEALGVRAGAKADADAEEGWRKWKKTVERLQGRLPALQKLLDVEERDTKATTVLERLKLRLDELAEGMGEFTQVEDLDATLKRYDEYLALTVRLEGLKKTLEILPPEAELKETHSQVTAEMNEARTKLGLMPGEEVSDVGVLHEEYSELVLQLVGEEEARNRLLAAASVGDRTGYTSAEVLSELAKELEILRLSLGGFEDAGAESDEVVAQFHASQKLHGEIEDLKADIFALRSTMVLDDWIADTRQPVLALEKKLQVAGDVNDLPGLRTRFSAFEALQETIRGLQEALEANPTLEELGDRKAHLRISIAEVQGRVQMLFQEHPRLFGWFEKYLEQPTGLRPAVTGNLERLKAEGVALEGEIDKTWTALRQHIASTSETRANLPLLDEDILRLRSELARLRIDRDALKRAIDLLTGLIEVIPDHLVGSLQIRAGDALSVLTDGRYTDLLLEGKQLEPVVVSPQGVTLRGEAVSGGLRDQLYFALRTAIAQELSGNISLPFVIDDPFVHLDRSRLHHAQICLKALGQRIQVILFTHDEGFRDCGSVACDLGQQPSGRIAVPTSRPAEAVPSG